MWRSGRCYELSITFICCLFTGLFTNAYSQIISQSVTKFEEHVNEYNTVPESDASVSGSLLSFMDLVRQRTVGNQVEQCPCVVLSGSNRCIAYDARFQASSLEEAIVAFVDTSLVDRSQGNLPITPATFECNTEECRQCAGLLLLNIYQISHVALDLLFPIKYQLTRYCRKKLKKRVFENEYSLPHSNFFTFKTVSSQLIAHWKDEIQGLLRGSLTFPFNLPTESALRTLGCQRLRISRPIPVRNPPQNAPTFVENLIDAGAPLRAEFDRASKSSFARAVDQEFNGGQPLVSRFISSTVGGGGLSTRTNQKMFEVSRNSNSAGAVSLSSSTLSPLTTHRPTVNTVVSFSAPRLLPARVVQTAPAVSNSRINTPSRQASQQQNNAQTSPTTITIKPQPTSINQSKFSPNAARPVPRLRNNVRNQKELQRLNQFNTPWQQPPRPQQQQSQVQNQALQFSPQLQPPPQSQFGNTPVQTPLQQTFQPQQPTQWPQQQSSNWQWETINNNPVTQPIFQQQQQFPQQSQVPNFNNYPSNTNRLDYSNTLGSNWVPAGQSNQMGNGWNGQPAQWQSSPLNNPTTQVGNPAVGEVRNLVPQNNNEQFGSSGIFMPGGVLPGSQQGQQDQGTQLGGLSTGLGFSQNNNGQFGSSGIPMPGGDSPGSQQRRGQELEGLSTGLGLSTAPSFSKRTKRANEENIIGDRFVINCVERGEPENENTEFLNLCTACWTWRQLPENYFPRLINELVCQESDYCLSGWGSCHQRYRNVDVLRRVGNDWRPTTISTASCCDCKVKAGSQIHPLVVGKNKR